MPPDVFAVGERFAEPSRMADALRLLHQVAQHLDLDPGQVAKIRNHLNNALRVIEPPQGPTTHRKKRWTAAERRARDSERTDEWPERH